MTGIGRLYKKLLRTPNALQFYEAVAEGRVAPDISITCRGKRDGGEMVEDEDVEDHIREIGIDYGQGYHFGRPAPELLDD